MKSLHFCSTSLVFILLITTVQTKDLTLGKVFDFQMGLSKREESFSIRGFNEELEIRFTRENTRRVKRPSSYHCRKKNEQIQAKTQKGL